MTPRHSSEPTPHSSLWLRRTLLSLLLLSVVLLLSGAFYLAWVHYHSQQLWQIVSQQCVPEFERSGSPAPCLLVNRAKRYAVFNDANGPLHTLLIPTDKISGIESPEILSHKAENSFQHGWDTRYFLQQGAAFPIPDRYLILAINSRYGRTQNQLHIHLACLKPEVYQSLLLQQDGIGHEWQALKLPLAGRHYLAIKVPETTDPFIALARYVKAQNDSMDNYGLGRVVMGNGEVVLLATRIRLTALSLGSAEELLDVDCALAKPAASPVE